MGREFFLGKVKLVTGRIIFIIASGDMSSIVNVGESLAEFLNTYRLETLKNINIEHEGSESISREQIDMFLPPIDNQEVWATGLSYSLDDEKEHQLKTNKPEYYSVYIHQRPMLFLKSMGGKVVGQNGELGLFDEKERVIPEAEIVLLINQHKEIIGYSSGNDVSVTSLENLNPLYQQQAKNFIGGCAIGPMWRLNTFKTLPEIEMSCTVIRKDIEITSYKYISSDLKHSQEYFINFLFEHRQFKPGVALFMGSNGGVSKSYSAHKDDEVVISNTLVGDLLGTFS